LYLLTYFFKGKKLCFTPKKKKNHLSSIPLGQQEQKDFQLNVIPKFFKNEKEKYRNRSGNGQYENNTSPLTEVKGFLWYHPTLSHSHCGDFKAIT
jgi:hypothetical protein